MQIKYNKTPRKTAAQYIVIHDTGNKSKGADAQAHFQYFNSADRQSSADIFVDSSGALVVNDYHAYYSWHCGDGRGRNGITNANSVGVELCINSDGDYNKTVENAVREVRRLMTELSVPASRVVRHFDASGKLCPASMSANNWSIWQSFKEKIAESDIERVQKKAELSDETMLYLKNYTYGQDLLRKLAQAM